MNLKKITLLILSMASFASFANYVAIIKINKDTIISGGDGNGGSGGDGNEGGGDGGGGGEVIPPESNPLTWAQYLTKKSTRCYNNTESLVEGASLRRCSNLEIGQKDPEFPITNFGIKRIAKMDFSNNKLENIDFMNGVTELEDLNLSGNPLTSLSGLNNVTTIDEKLTLSKITGLDNLTGLNNLSTLGGLMITDSNISNFNSLNVTNLSNSQGGLYLGNLPKITSLETLNVTNVSGNVSFSGDFGMNDFTGSKISNIGMSLYVKDSNSVETLNGLESIKNIKSWVHIVNNKKLTNIDGISGVTTAYSLEIKNNPLLKTLPTNFKSSNLSLRIENNNALENLNIDFASKTGMGFLEINRNPNLKTISGFNNATSLRKVDIVSNNLTSVTGFKNLETIPCGNSPYNFNIEAPINDFKWLSNISKCSYGTSPIVISSGSSYVSYNKEMFPIKGSPWCTAKMYTKLSNSYMSRLSEEACQ